MSGVIAALMMLVVMNLHAQSAAQRVVTSGEAALNAFAISTIGDPRPWRTGSVTVGDTIRDVVITAVDVNQNTVPGYNGVAYLAERTLSGDGRIWPDSIQFVNGEWQGEIIVYRAGIIPDWKLQPGDVWIEVSDRASPVPHVGLSNQIHALPSVYKRLMILLPGETHAPGSISGKSGQPLSQQEGSEFFVDILAVDNYWNFVKRRVTETDTSVIFDNVLLTSSDPTAQVPGTTLRMDTGKIQDVPVTLNISGSTLSVQNSSDNTILSYTTTVIPVTNEGLDHFVVSAITGPVTAGDSVALALRAETSSNILFADFDGFVNVTTLTGSDTISNQVVGPFVAGQWSGKVLITRAGNNISIQVSDGTTPTHTGTSNVFEVLAGDLADLLVLLPGESFTPGIAPGKTGFTEKQLAGESFSIQVIATDVWWNAVQPGELNLHFSTTDSLALLPADTTQSVGAANYTVAFFTQGQNQLFVQAQNHPVLTEPFSSSEFFLDLGTVDHFTFSTIGSVQTAGKNFAVRIEALNRFDNLVADYSGEIVLSASTGNGTASVTGITLVNGVWEDSLYVTQAGEDVVLYASDFIAPPFTHTGASNAFTVLADSLAGLQLILPGQVATPGVAPGVKNQPDALVAGIPADITVRAVDRFWNVITANQEGVTLASSDSFTVFPESIVLVNGEAVVPTVFRAAVPQQVFAQFEQPLGFPTAKSDSVAVVANNFSQLLLLQPGETLLPGDDETDVLQRPGRIGTPVIQTTGLAFDVTVLAVDNFWNPVATAPAHRVGLFLTDNQAVITPPDTVLVNGQAHFTIILSQGGNQVVRATDLTDQQIADSPDGVVNVLVGGLHYEITVSTTQVTAGQPFSIDVAFKNGIGELVTAANNLVNIVAVSSSNLDAVVETPQNASFNLQAGRRSQQLLLTKTGPVRLKVADDLGNEAVFSETIQISAAAVASIGISAEKQELGATQSTSISVTLQDGFDNLVPAREVQFAVVSGGGQVSESSVVTDAAGAASVNFTAGTVTEVNRIRVSADSVAEEIDIVVNLTTSDQEDGVVVNYPNPFGHNSETTTIDYYLSQDADVTLKIFDFFGNLVWSAEFSAGTPGGRGRGSSLHPNSVVWNGQNDRGQKVGNGGYILVARAIVDGKVVMDTKRKIVVLR